MHEKYLRHGHVAGRDRPPVTRFGDWFPSMLERIKRSTINKLALLNEKLGVNQVRLAQESTPTRMSIDTVAHFREGVTYLEDAYKAIPTESVSLVDHNNMRQFTNEFVPTMESLARDIPSGEYVQSLLTGKIPLTRANINLFNPQALVGLGIEIGKFQEMMREYNLVDYSRGESMLKNPLTNIGKHLTHVTETWWQELETEENRYALAKGLFALLRGGIQLPLGTTVDDVRSLLGLDKYMQRQFGKGEDESLIVKKFKTAKDFGVTVAFDETTERISVKLVSRIHKDNMSVDFRKMVEVISPEQLVDIGNVSGDSSKDIESGRYIADVIGTFLPFCDDETLARVNVALQADRMTAAQELARYRQELLIPRLLINAARSVSKDEYKQLEYKQVDPYTAVNLLKRASGFDVDRFVDSYSLREIIRERQENWLQILIRMQQLGGKFPKHIVDQVKSLFADQQEQTPARGGRDYYYLSSRHHALIKFHMVNEFDREIVLAPNSVRDDVIAKLGEGIYDIDVTTRNVLSSDKKEGVTEMVLSGVNSKGERRSATIRRKLPPNELAALV